MLWRVYTCTVGHIKLWEVYLEMPQVVVPLILHNYIYDCSLSTEVVFIFGHQGNVKVTITLSHMGRSRTEVGLSLKNDIWESNPCLAFIDPP